MTSKYYYLIESDNPIPSVRLLEFGKSVAAESAGNVGILQSLTLPDIENIRTVVVDIWTALETTIAARKNQQ